MAIKLRTAEEVFVSIPGGKEIVTWFGVVPNFHDAEILSLCLNRQAESEMRIHTWMMTSETGDRGLYVLDRHAVVTLFMNGIANVELSGFSRQNVIDGLSITRAEPHAGFEIVLNDCYGLSGTILCHSLRMEFTPGKP